MNNVIEDFAKEVKLPCAIDENGKTVYIQQAKNGLACKCFCPGCMQPVIAKNGGTKRKHHFAHQSTSKCEHGYQSALHYMAKDCFLEMKQLAFIKNGKPVRYKIDAVELEKRIDEIIPDIVVVCDGKKFIVEIYVTHAVDEKKKEKIKSLRLSAVEINLSQFRHQMLVKEMLIKELYNTRNISWLHDADNDFISEKKEIIQQFGLRLKKSHDNYLPCPMVVEQPDGTFRLISYEFCKSCVYCCDDEHPRYIRCGYALPFPINHEIRRKLSPAVIVNENKVMFASEFQKYWNNFLRYLPLYTRRCFRDPR